MSFFLFQYLILDLILHVVIISPQSPPSVNNSSVFLSFVIGTPLKRTDQLFCRMFIWGCLMFQTIGVNLCVLGRMHYIKGLVILTCFVTGDIYLDHLAMPF